MGTTKRFIIGIEDDDDEATHVSSMAVSVLREVHLGDRRHITVEIDEAEAEKLRSRPRVRFVEEDGEVSLIEPVEEQANTESEQLPWGVDRVQAELAHEDGNTGSGATVAIVDTGIDRTHADLEGNIIGGYNATDGGTDFQDDNGHGTHVSGTVAAIDNTTDVIGVAPDANLYGVKVLQADGSGTWSDVAEGIVHATDQGADVINMSLGGGFSSAVADAVQYANNNGVFIAAAAGNSGSCTDCVGFPASAPEAMAVSAMDTDDTLAFFSSTGPEVEIIAPGVSIPSTALGGGTESLSGTSMASPHIAGAGAICMAAGMTASEARNRISSTAEDIGLPDNEQGNGLLNADKLIQQNMAREQTFSATKTIDATPQTATLKSFQVDSKPDSTTAGQATMVVSGNEAGTYYANVVDDSDTQLYDANFDLTTSPFEKTITFELPASETDYQIHITGGIVTDTVV